MSFDAFDLYDFLSDLGNITPLLIITISQNKFNQSQKNRHNIFR